MKFLEKIRSLPEKTRKIILWLTVSVLAAGLFAWWLSSLPERLSGFQPGSLIEQLGLPKIEIPKIAIPEIKTNAQEATPTQEN